MLLCSAIRDKIGGAKFEWVYQVKSVSVPLTPFGSGSFLRDSLKNGDREGGENKRIVCMMVRTEHYHYIRHHDNRYLYALSLATI